MSGHRKRGPKGGRTPLSEDAKKSGKIEFRVNAEEAAELHRLAKQAGMPLSAFIRKAALGCKIEGPPPLQNIQAHRSLVKTGNLLNQAIWKVHSGQIRHLDWEILSDLKRDVKALAYDLIEVRQ